MVSIVGAIVIAAGLVWLIATLAGPRTTAAGAVLPGLFDATRWDIFVQDPLLWIGIRNGIIGTLQMAAVAAFFALVIGILFSFGRTAQSNWIRVPVAVLLEFFRGMPVLLMMLFVLLVFETSGYWAGVSALAVYNGAIIGEALRAGIQSLPRGQREAGLSIGLTPVATRFLIEFPQAFRQMLPIIIAQLVVLLKDTSLAYIVGYSELLQANANLTGYYGNRYAFSIFFVILAIYLAINFTVSWIARVVARRTASTGGKATTSGDTEDTGLTGTGTGASRKAPLGGGGMSGGGGGPGGPL